MATADDVAAAILEIHGRPMSAMKMQKLVYYSQVWHAVWTRHELFPEEIQAWAMGPVVPHLYRQHRGAYEVRQWPSGSVSELTMDERADIQAVYEVYGHKSAKFLSDLTHSEQPWREARAGLPGDAPSSAAIDINTLIGFYSGD